MSSLRNIGRRYLSSLSGPLPGRSRQPTVVDPASHTMGDSLHRYLAMKVHPDITTQQWEKITIKPSHLRSAPACVSSIEKTGKLFNWQRPTVSHHDAGRSIDVHCFPGRDYVQHYASIIATYLSLQGRDPGIVHSIDPGPEDCMEPLLRSNLQKLGKVDTVVVGYVHGLPTITGAGPWEDEEATNEIFAWKTRGLSDGSIVAFLGCRISFWGSIAGNLVRALQQLCQVRRVLYVGKLGSLKPEHVPNRVLACGDTTWVNGASIEWNNILEPAARSIDDGSVQFGRHYTLPSVLDETHEWFAAHQEFFEWVDPEIGHMVLASIAGGTEFGYLHIVSDDLAKKYLYDLSNERLRQVVQDRADIAVKVEGILSRYLQGI